jgi:hypothetical protein
MAIFKDDAPILGVNAAIDEGLGIETNVGSKIIGSFEEVLYAQFQGSIPTAGSVTTFIAPYPLELIGGAIIWGGASASGTIQLVHDGAGVVVPGAGTALLGSPIPTSTTANTVFKFPKSQAFANVNSSLQLAAYDKLTITFAGTFTGQTNLVVMAQFKRI